MEGEVTVVGFSKIKPEYIEEAKPFAEKFIGATRSEEGNIFYNWYKDVKDESSGVAISRFKSIEALQAHSTSEIIKEAEPKFKEWAAIPPVVRVLKPDNIWADSKDGDENSIVIVAVIHVKPECIEAARPVQAKLLEATRKEPGCNRYDWYQDIKEPGVLVVIENYSNMEAFEAHGGSAHLKEFIESSK